ncbi:MAG TPA: FAD-dependent oxidoreductase [Terriglobia bacterium]|nr:FAD-dependent oxidoreductase [Terriglobia bacterium]
MSHTQYLIIGGGMTADSAVQGIRHADANGSIGIISVEPHPPYNRPPLSKGLWKGDAIESIWRKTESPGVELHLGREVKHLDAKNKRVTDDQGTVHTFEKLLLATGGSVRRLPFGGDHIIYFRTLDDYQRLRALTEKGKRFAVIGGGFIGWEVAAALAMNGRRVTMLFPEEGIGSRIYPRGLSQFLNGFYREKGVEVLPGETAVALERHGESFVLKTKSGRALEVDGVAAGIGIQPNTALAEAAGLETGNGVVVNEKLQTSQPDIYAAGDLAEFYNPALGKRMRVEHEDNANTMGQAAGEAMAGKAAPYHHLPFFYSDLFDLGYEAVGELDSRLETFSDWKTPQREGVVYYLDKGRVRGVLLWNTWGQVDHARKLIAEAGPFKGSDLKGRLPVE